MSIEKKQTVGLAIGFAYGACLMLQIASAHGAEEPDALIAQLRQICEPPVDIAALTGVQEQLAKRVRQGDTAATDACALVFDELRIRPASWWGNLSRDEYLSTKLLQSTLLRVFAIDELGFVSYAERAFDDSNTRLPFTQQLLSALGAMGAYEIRPISESTHERISRLLMRAARAENIKVHRHALMIMSGYFRDAVSMPAWDVQAAIPVIREYAEDWTEDPIENGWFAEALVELKADGHERYIREFEAYVQDANNYDVLRLKFAKHLLRWGRIDEARVVELEKLMAEKRKPKTVTIRNGKKTVEILDENQ